MKRGYTILAVFMTLVCIGLAFVMIALLPPDEYEDGYGYTPDYDKVEDSSTYDITLDEEGAESLKVEDLDIDENDTFESKLTDEEAVSSDSDELDDNTTVEEVRQPDIQYHDEESTDEDEILEQYEVPEGVDPKTWFPDPEDTYTDDVVERQEDKNMYKLDEETGYYIYDGE